jgi:hypothetical protein
MTRPLASSTARARRCRQRKRDGKVPLTIEADEAGLEALLTRHGLLSSCGSDDRAVVTAALERLLQLLIAHDAEQHRG